MENKIIIKSFMRQFDQVIVHEQVENGVDINKNLSACKIE
jgi:hypothetical protein